MDKNFINYKKNKEMQTFNFSLTLQEANTVLKSLQTLPYGEVAPLIEKIMLQAKEQEENKNKQEEAPQPLKAVKK